MDAASETPALPGQQLAEARERQGLSRAEVAQRLHMSPWQVEALEAGDYSRLPKGTFLRGFVRNYAKLVSLESEPLLSGLAQAAPGEIAPRIVVPSQNIRFEPLHERISGSPYWKGGMIAAVVLAFGAAVLYWFAEVRNSPPPAVAAAPAKPAGPEAQQIAAAPLPAAETPPPTEAPKVEAAPTPPETPAAVAAPKKPDVAAPKKPDAAAPKKPDAAKPTAAPVPAPTAIPAANTTAVGSGPGRLAFRFRGDSWVEVKDASGKVVMSRLNAAGSQAQVSGRPPFEVIVGNAPDVTLRYNDRDFPLEPHTKVAVARFTLE